MNASVAIVQRIVPHYRVPFFGGLHERLAGNGVDLTLYYGQQVPGGVPRDVVVGEPWAVRTRNRYLRIGAVDLVWQPCLSSLRNFDLVVVEQANRMLINSVLQAGRRWLRPRLAFWGHGRNLQARGARSWREALKRRRACDVDWWFAYTGLTRDYLVDCGFPLERITTVNNTIDESNLQRALESCRQEAVSDAKTMLGLKSGPVGLYCGGLYRDKRIDFLVAACSAIKARLPDFQLIVIGEGPEAATVTRASNTADWIHYLGPIYGEERAVYLKMADVLLMPGAVGLVIIDSFVAETPLVTTDVNSHGPEIAYLQAGVNGIISPDSISSYADAVATALLPEKLESMRAGCRASAQSYSLQRMIENFAEGIHKVLGP